MRETDELAELYAYLKVDNLKDAKQSIAGLRERVKFTEDYERLRDGVARPDAVACIRVEYRRGVSITGVNLVDDGTRPTGFTTVGREQLERQWAALVKRFDRPMTFINAVAVLLHHGATLWYT